MSNEEKIITNIMQRAIENWIDLSHNLIDDEQYQKTYDTIRKEAIEDLKKMGGKK